MGCGCGKKFSQSKQNVPVPPIILAEAMRKMAEQRSKSEADKPSEFAQAAAGEGRKA